MIDGMLLIGMVQIDVRGVVSSGVVPSCGSEVSVQCLVGNLAYCKRNRQDPMEAIFKYLK